MLIIDRQETNPYFNIAAEEYFFKSFTEDIFMLWQNESSVIIGKHQNPEVEVNQDYILKYNIPVIRRISGGGAVYNDLGNINYTYIITGEIGKLVDYFRFTSPIIEFLQTFGIHAKLENKSNLTINGEKFSGNAEHIHKTRVLHHGTILFSTSLNDLKAALNVQNMTLSGYSVRSKKSNVTNIIKFLNYKYDLQQFKASLLKFIFNKNLNNNVYILSEKDKKIINELVVTKYSTKKWNYDYSNR
ncbi:MAG: biotin/lipoate A/B protein ligase family protein [Bacteroidetes bacterium]|nr:biotin/lipoate A/B protein ligase family protein [Bacteroidota bacterium]